MLISKLFCSDMIPFKVTPQSCNGMAVLWLHFQTLHFAPEQKDVGMVVKN